MTANCVATNHLIRRVSNWARSVLDVKFPYLASTAVSRLSSASMAGFSMVVSIASSN